MLEFLISNNMVCHATEAMLCASIGCAILAVLITQMKISSIGFTMAHGAFAGAAIGTFFGINMTISAIISSIVLAIILGPLADKSRMPIDTTLGVLFGALMAVAIFFYALMAQLERGYDASSLLFGNVLALYREEIFGLLIVMIIGVMFVAMFYKEISAMIFHTKIAEIAGIRVKPMKYGVLFMIAIMVALSMPFLGGLLLYVFLVTPAAIAYQFCGTLKQMMFVAPTLAALLSITGTGLAFQYNLPIAPLIAVIFSITFVISVIISPRRRVHVKNK